MFLSQNGAFCLLIAGAALNHSFLLTIRATAFHTETTGKLGRLSLL